MFRNRWLPLALLACASASFSFGQDATPDLRRDTTRRITPSQDSSLGVLTPTPEMWFYEQERARHDDPKLSIRRRAELKGVQRAERLASLKWYGLSNSRPTVSSTPWFGGYSPSWGSNTVDPFRWRPAAAAVIVRRPTNPAY